MLIKELRNILEEYDGEMEIIFLDDNREVCDLDKNRISLYLRDEEPKLALHEIK